MHRVCLREAERMLGRGAHAEDAAQEATVRAWRQRGKCRSPDAPTPWIRQIARNEALREAGSRAHVPLDQHAEVGRHPPADEDLLLAADVRRALRRISPEDRALLLARYWADLSHSETAERVGIAEPTVRVRLHRIHKRLRAQFQ